MEGPHLSRQRWLKLVEAQRVSELKVDQFCERYGLAVSTFYGWKRRFKDEGLLSADARAESGLATPSEAKAPPRGPTNSGDTPAFVEVTASTEHDGHGQPLELVLPGEVVVRIPRGFDPDTLRQVVEALS